MILYSNEPLSRTYGGRVSARPTLTAYQIKQETEKFLRKGISPHAERLIQVLAVGGIMSVSQLMRLGVKLRTLQKYSANYLLDRFPRSSTDLLYEFQHWGLPCDMKNREETLLYLLGPVGLEIARQRGFTPETGFLASPVSHYMNQVIVNEMRVRLSEFAAQRQYEVNWLDRAQTQVITGGEEERVLLPPTPMLSFQKGALSSPFFLAFYEKLSTFQCRQIIRGYEKVRFSEAWHGQWAGEHFPPLLLVVSESESARTFQQVLNEDEFSRCTFYGKLLKGVVSPETSIGEWINIKTGNRVMLLP